MTIRKRLVLAVGTFALVAAATFGAWSAVGAKAAGNACPKGRCPVSCSKEAPCPPCPSCPGC
jgi:hypothetical protein